MEWIGRTVCEMFAFKLYCDLETGVRSHSKSSKVALFDRAHTTFRLRFRDSDYSLILVENRYTHSCRPIWRPHRAEAVRLRNNPW